MCRPLQILTVTLLVSGCGTKLTQQQIDRGLSAIRDHLQACYTEHKAAGRGKMKLTIGVSGRVEHADVSGDLAGSPSAKCLSRAVTARAVFPAFSGDPLVTEQYYALPLSLTRQEIHDGMQGVSPQVQRCFDRYKKPGVVHVRIVLAPAGRVTRAWAIGTFKLTPTGKCVAEAVKKAKIPRFYVKPLQMTYPFVLKASAPR